MEAMVQIICVCGAGTMGSGIAQVAASNGFHTILYDVNTAMLARAKEGITQNLAKLVEKKRIEQSTMDSTIARLRFTSNNNECIADLVIEAIVEKLEIKQQLFNQLASINSDTTVFASNTSSLSITAIAETITNPERVAGMHFFNPAPQMKLVELVAGRHTTAQTLQILTDTVQRMQKTAVHCKDAPGFIVNHVARPYYLEALFLAEQGLADFKTIDELLESAGFKMGPFKLMDLIGNDINFAVSAGLYEAMGKPVRLKPSAIQENKVIKGELGKKTGRGYYVYP